ncbi:uncharacterized protein J3R85_020383 [Psidium guajava]|nr:uncharacterized protein J3R85_020383 [Psidium guajava]
MRNREPDPVLPEPGTKPEPQVRFFGSRFYPEPMLTPSP